MTTLREKLTRLGEDMRKCRACCGVHAFEAQELAALASSTPGPRSAEVPIRLIIHPPQPEVLARICEARGLDARAVGEAVVEWLQTQKGEREPGPRPSSPTSPEGTRDEPSAPVCGAKSSTMWGALTCDRLAGHHGRHAYHFDGVPAPAPVPSSGTRVTFHAPAMIADTGTGQAFTVERPPAVEEIGAAAGARIAAQIAAQIEAESVSSETRTAPAIWETLSGTFEVRASCPRHPFAPMRRCGEIARCSECGDAIAICDDICGWKHCVREKGHAGLHVSPSGTSWPSPRTARPQGDPDHDPANSSREEK